MNLDEKWYKIPYRIFALLVLALTVFFSLLLIPIIANNLPIGIIATGGIVGLWYAVLTKPATKHNYIIVTWFFVLMGAAGVLVLFTYHLWAHLIDNPLEPTPSAFELPLLCSPIILVGLVETIAFIRSLKNKNSQK